MTSFAPGNDKGVFAVGTRSGHTDVPSIEGCEYHANGKDVIELVEGRHDEVGSLKLSLKIKLHSRLLLIAA